VLRGAAELRSITIHHCLEAGAVVALVPAGPQRLQHVGQLLGELTLGAELARVDLVAPLEVSLWEGRLRIRWSYLDIYRL